MVPSTWYTRLPDRIFSQGIWVNESNQIKNNLMQVNSKLKKNHLGTWKLHHLGIIQFFFIYKKKWETATSSQSIRVIANIFTFISPNFTIQHNAVSQGCREKQSVCLSFVLKLFNCFPTSIASSYNDSLWNHTRRYECNSQVMTWGLGTSWSESNDHFDQSFYDHWS